MGPATPPALRVLESCPLRGGPSGRVRGRRKRARMRKSPVVAADPLSRASTEARRDHHSQHPRRLPRACAFCPRRPFVSPPGAEFGMAWRQRGP